MYYDLTDAKTYDAIFDVLVNVYWLDEKLVDFAFGSFGCNEDTLDHIEYYYWIDHENLLERAGITDEDEEEDEDTDED